MKKMIAPIIIAILTILGLLAYCGILFLAPMGLGIKILIGIIYFALCGVAIFVLVERIKEIRSGEEDDLSKY
ncbi:MAG: hypothetical protein IKZ25_05365 [Clostridia bacterium]|nr:hypothetical protein [Clostridia bacterium]